MESILTALLSSAALTAVFMKLFSNYEELKCEVRSLPLRECGLKCLSANSPCHPPNSCYTKTKHSNRKKVAAMGFFKKKEKAAPSGDFDRENEKPIIKASICNGEQIAGFKNIHTGKMREIMLIKTSADLEYFKTMYGIETEIEKEY